MNEELNVTIGEVLDQTKEHLNNIMFVLRERKYKKQACDKESLKKECFKRFGMDEGIFSYNLSQLITNGEVSENIRSSKSVYTPTLGIAQNSFNSYGEGVEIVSEFVNLKKFVSETFMEVNHKLEKQKSSINELGTIIDMKDTIIKLLREELENTRTLLKISLENERQNQQCVSEQKIAQKDLLKNSNSIENKNLMSIKVSSLEKDHAYENNSCITNESLSPIHENIENSLAEQLKHIRKTYHKKFIKSKETINKEQNITHRNKDNKNICFAKDTTVIMGDSMLNGIEEKRLSKHGKIKVRYFPGARVVDMYDNIKPILKRKPGSIILHVGTNNSVDMTSNEILDEILTLKNTIEKENKNCKVVISSIIDRVDDGKASLTVKKLNQHLKQLKVDIMDNNNIQIYDLGKKGLHLSEKGKSKFATNIIKKVKAMQN